MASLSISYLLFLAGVVAGVGASAADTAARPERNVMIWPLSSDVQLDHWSD